MELMGDMKELVLSLRSVEGPPSEVLPTFACSQHTVHSSVYLIPGAFEIEINGQLVFSKLENGGFPYEKDVSICNVGNIFGSPCSYNASSYSTSLHFSLLRPSEEPVTENP